MSNICIDEGEGGTNPDFTPSVCVRSESRREYLILSVYRGTCTHDDAKDGAPIDQTERRHDVTFISVDVASRDNSTGF
jgi:hypothetical protein